MAKVLEGPGMGLLKKWGMTVPDYLVVTSVEQFEMLGEANKWLQERRLVVKAHEAIGSRFKLGLVKIDLNLNGAKAAVKEMLGKAVGGGLVVSQVIISEMVPHKEEYYIAVKSVREGAEILLADFGGIDVEANWDRIRKMTVPVGETPSLKSLEKLAVGAGYQVTTGE